MGETHEEQPKLPDYLELVAERAAQKAIDRHTSQCPIKDVQAKVQKLEVKWATMLGYLTGAGATGGATIFGLVKLFGA
jgi:hypothetical protein